MTILLVSKFGELRPPPQGCVNPSFVTYGRLESPPRGIRAAGHAHPRSNRAPSVSGIQGEIAATNRPSSSLPAYSRMEHGRPPLDSCATSE